MIRRMSWRYMMSARQPARVRFPHRVNAGQNRPHEFAQDDVIAYNTGPCNIRLSGNSPKRAESDFNMANQGGSSCRLRYRCAVILPARRIAPAARKNIRPDDDAVFVAVPAQSRCPHR